MADLQYSQDTWLGEVPAHWAVVPAKALFSNPVERNHSDDVHLTPSQKYGVLPQAEYMEITGSRVVLNLSGADNMRHVEPGDYISHLRSFQGGLEYSPYKGKVSSAYTVLRPKQTIEPRYYKHLFKSSRYIQGLSTTTEQLRDGQSIRYEQFALLPLPFPPVEDQKAIADFLDGAIAKIDKILEIQFELKNKIDERRKSLIVERVSGSQSSYSTHELAGSDWLDQTPNHWNVKRLKYSIAQTKGGVWGGEPEDSDEAIWCVRIADFDRKSLRVTTDTKTFRSVPANERIGRLLRPGMLIVEKSGGGDKTPVGAVVLFDHPGLAVSSNFTNVIRLKDGMYPGFWAYVHQALYVSGRTWKSIKQTSGIQNLDFENYLNELAPFPPLDQQISISDQLDQELSEIAKLQAALDSLCDLLTERRAALISAAVTGKIDVRGRN